MLYDNTDSNIEYLGTWRALTNRSDMANGTGSLTDTLDDSLRFNFTGSKFQLFGSVGIDKSNNINIIIDNISYIVNAYHSTTVNSYLLFTINNLSLSEHTVVIINKSTITAKRLVIDYINLNDNELLKPYNINNIKYLIKQQDKYYSIKPDFYSNGNFTPLTLAGGDTPNDHDFNNNGFDDIGDLCKTYDTENYIVNNEILNDGKLFIVSIPNNIKNIYIIN